MNQEEQRLLELADFLKTRRMRLSPAQVGIPVGSRRRTAGLRREEVAQMAGISTTWYTWLEQGRPIQVSDNVVESLARTLQLGYDERVHLFMLARNQLPPNIASYELEAVSPSLQETINYLEVCPAYVIGERFDILAWNHAMSVLIEDFSKLSGHDRNIVWRMFTKMEYRQLFVNWEEHAQRLLAHFRVVYGRNIKSPWFNQFIEELKIASPEFQDWWLRHDVLGCSEGTKEVNHPSVGHLIFNHQNFEVAGEPSLLLTVYTPVKSTDTEEKLRRLIKISSS